MKETNNNPQKSYIVKIEQADRDGRVIYQADNSVTLWFNEPKCYPHALKDEAISRYCRLMRKSIGDATQKWGKPFLVYGNDEGMVVTAKSVVRIWIEEIVG